MEKSELPIKEMPFFAVQGTLDIYSFLRGNRDCEPVYIVGSVRIAGGRARLFLADKISK
jgi:hypothetical protein